MFSFLRTIGLDPIEWTEAIKMTGKASPYIGEILDAAFANAQAVVVVMTPDDEAKLRDQYISENDPQYENTLTPQARPNVLFEAGIAFGRHPNRTVLIEVGTLRPFSDIGGRHTIRLDDSMAKRQELAHRLRTAGCKVDTDGTDWHTEGDFEAEAINGRNVGGEPLTASQPPKSQEAQSEEMRGPNISTSPNLEITIVEGRFAKDFLSKDIEGLVMVATFAVDVTLRPSEAMLIDSVLLDVLTAGTQIPRGYEARNPFKAISTRQTHHLAFGLPTSLRVTEFTWKVRVVSNGREWESQEYAYESDA
jgi:hypothetical protein